MKGRCGIRWVTESIRTNEEVSRPKHCPLHGQKRIGYEASTTSVTGSHHAEKRRLIDTTELHVSGYQNNGYQEEGVGFAKTDCRRGVIIILSCFPAAHCIFNTCKSGHADKR